MEPRVHQLHVKTQQSLHLQSSLLELQVLKLVSVEPHEGNQETDGNDTTFFEPEQIGEVSYHDRTTHEAEKEHAEPTGQEVAQPSFQSLSR